MNNNFMVLQVRGTGGTDRVRSLVDEDVRSDLENIDGVASVNIYGGRQKAIEVRLNPEACKALNLTASKISGLLSAEYPGKEHLKASQMNPTARILSMSMRCIPKFLIWRI